MDTLWVALASVASISLLAAAVTGAAAILRSVAAGDAGVLPVVETAESTAQAA